MARKKPTIQQHASPARQITAEERRRDVVQRGLVSFLEARGYRPHKLPHWRTFRHNPVGSYYLGPACLWKGHSLYGAGAVRRAGDAACVACTLHLPPLIADARKAPR